METPVHGRALLPALPAVAVTLALGLSIRGSFLLTASSNKHFLLTASSNKQHALLPASLDDPPSQEVPEACRRRLRMPAEEQLAGTFQALVQKEDRLYNRTEPLAPLVAAGTKAVVVLDSLATMEGKYARARLGHRETWFQRPGVCAPKRHGEEDCVLFPVFFMTAGGPHHLKCKLSMEEYRAAEAAARADNKTSPERSESVLLRWRMPYVQPWWEPWSLTHDVPRHLVMLKTALVRYPWMTHFVKQDLDTYPYFFWALPAISQPPAGHAARTGHVYLGQWKIMGVWRGERQRNATGLHKLAGDCGGVPSGNGNHVASGCKAVRDKKWGGGFVSVDFRAANDGWCNDWAVQDRQEGCFNHNGGLGICSGFMYGHLWSYSRSLAQAIVDSKDPRIYKVQGNFDHAHSDIRAGGWVNRIVLGANESVELRAACGWVPWRHFGR